MYTKKVRRMVVEDHLGLVEFCLRFKLKNLIRRSGAEIDDCRQVGRIALMRALELYKPGNGFTFSTYATEGISRAIGRWTRDNRLIRTPGYVHVREGFQEEPEIVPIESVDLDQVLPPPVSSSVDPMLVIERLSRLDPRSLRIIVLRYGLFGHSEHTLEQIASIFGVSRERIRQIEDKALVRMRKSKLIRRKEVAS